MLRIVFTARKVRPSSAVTLAVMLCINANLTGVAPGDELEVDVPFLQAAWEKKQNEILTADIKYRLFQQFKPELKSLSRRSIRANMASVRSKPYENLCLEIAKFVFADYSRHDQPWSDCRYLFDGLRYRVEEAGTTRVFDGNLELLKRKRRGFTDLTLGSEYEMPIEATRSLDDFHWFPAMNRMSADAVIISPLKDGNFELLYRDDLLHMTLRLDAVSWDVLSAEISMPDGTPIMDLFQYDISAIGDGVYFPGSQVVVKYDTDELAFVRVMEIVSMDVNVPIRDSDFLLATSPGESVRDLRGEKPIVYKQKQELDDAQQSVPLGGGLDQGGTVPDKAKKSSWSLILMLNCMFLIAIGLWLCLRTYNKKRS